MSRAAPIEQPEHEDMGVTPSPVLNTIAARLEPQLKGSRLRVLIVGAGIGGSTLSALLRQRGVSAALIERGSKAEDGGYMLGLLPLGGRVLNGLGLSEAYAEKSLAVDTYPMYDRNGRLIRRYPLAPLVERFGSWRGIERGALLAMLREVAGPICFDTTVTRITEREATFHDGSKAEFDVIIGADGIHSSTRKWIVPPEKIELFDTGWGGFVLWSRPESYREDTFSELWSAGWGVGLYPVPGRVGIFLAGRHAELETTDAETYAAKIEDRLPPGPFLEALIARERTAQQFYWRMADCRAKVWSRGRTVLLGDAAAAFLPTAGVGASAAMDSAAALADELSRADSDHMSYALELYEKRQRDRVERMERNSRNLARLMFVSDTPTAWARDQAMKWYSLERLVSNISRVMSGE